MYKNIGEQDDHSFRQGSCSPPDCTVVCPLGAQSGPCSVFPILESPQHSFFENPLWWVADMTSGEKKDKTACHVECIQSM